MVEHATEFHAFDQLQQFLCIGFNRFDGVFVFFFTCHLEQVTRVAQLGIDLDQGMDDVFQRFFFFAQFLGAFRLVPDFRVFQFAVNLV